jgi:hypothetical protein
MKGQITDYNPENLLNSLLKETNSKRKRLGKSQSSQKLINNFNKSIINEYRPIMINLTS